MRPFMRDKAIIYMPVTDKNGKPIIDKYSKPQTKPMLTNARVRKTSSIRINSRAQFLDGLVEIDIPKQKGDIPQGVKVEFWDAQGYKGSGHVQSVETSVNLSGSRIEFRTLHVDISKIL